MTFAQIVNEWHEELWRDIEDHGLQFEIAQDLETRMREHGHLKK